MGKKIVWLSNLSKVTQLPGVQGTIWTQGGQGCATQCSAQPI